VRYRPLSYRRPRIRFGLSGGVNPLASLIATLGATAKGIFTAPATTTVIASGVSTWTDQSATGDLTQATGANQPALTTVGGRTWVTFDATDALTRASLGTGLNFDLFLRVRYNTPNPYGCAAAFASTLATAGGKWGVVVDASSGNKVVAAIHGSAFTANATPTLAADTTAILHYRGDGNTAWASGWAGFVGMDALASEAISLGGMADATGFLLGTALSGSTSNLLVSDAILLDGATAAGRQAVLDYLNAT
jgi:hypothetical protein